MRFDNAKIVDRIFEELDKRKIKQTDLLDLCKAALMPISQPDISKILSGKKKSISTYQLASISRALNVPIDFLVWGQDAIREDFCNPYNSPRLYDSGSDLEYYRGKIQIYFLSTIAFEDKLLHGEMEVYEERGYNVADMALDTGEVDRTGKRIIKNYRGRILVSSVEAMGGVYLLLKNDEIGELSMICFKHRNYNTQNMECRMGLALTIGAGDAKEPTVHRCLVTRKRLDGQVMEEIRPWLGLIGNDISIEKNKFEKVIEKFIAKNPDLETELRKAYKCAFREERVILSVNEMKNRLDMTREKKNDFISALYEISDTSENYRISQSDDMQFYERLQTVLRKEEKT